MSETTRTLITVELDEVLDELSGFDWLPGMDLILSGVRELAATAARRELSLDDTQNAVEVIASTDNPDLTLLFALLVRALTDMQSNPVLRELPPNVAEVVREHGAIHAMDVSFVTRSHANQAIGLIAHS